MSYTSLYEIYKTKAVSFKELGNEHGSGPAIWDYIALKCTGGKFPMFGADTKGFWAPWKDERLSENEKAVLLSTYDQAVIEIDKLDIFSKACEEVHHKILSDSNWEWSHFESIGEQALSLYEKHDYRCLGLAIGCTSVCDPWEFWKPGEGEREPWYIYSEIEALKTAVAV
jgi:hypothetical protein